MTIEVKVGDLQNAISRTTIKFIDGKSPDVSLQCLRIEAKDNTLVFSGTDLECFLRYTLAVTHDEQWQTLVDGRALSSLVSNLSSTEKATMSLGQSGKDGARLHIECTGKKYKFETKDAAVFPNFLSSWEKENVGHDTYALIIPVGELMKAASRTAHIQGGLEKEAKINAVNIEINADIFRCIGTDGRRIGISTHACESSIDQQLFIVGRKPFLATATALSNLYGSLDKVNMLFNDKLIVFYCKDMAIALRPHATTFPDYSMLLNLDLEHSITIDRKLLIESLKRLAGLFSDDYTGSGVRMKAEDGTLFLSTYLAKRNEGEEILPLISSRGSFQLCANGLLITQALAVMEAESEKTILSHSARFILQIEPENQEEKFIYILAGLRGE